MTISEISLTSGLRSTLQAQTDAGGKLAKAEERLSSGKRVNSPLDSPAEFFAAMQLKQYADDLSELHDGINETIETIKAATDGISGISQLLQTMKGVVDNARNTTDPQARARCAAAYDELYAQINYLASDSSYKGANLIGDSDASVLRWQADDLVVRLNPSGSAQYDLPGKFLGSGYAFNEAGNPDITWLPDQTGSALYPCTAGTTALPPGSTAAATAPSKLDFVFVIDVTGSMGLVLDQVKGNASSFVENLKAAGVDGRFASVKFRDITMGDDAILGLPILPTFLSNSATFTAGLPGLADADGGGDAPESGLEAILTAFSSLSFRPDAEKRMLLITDNKVHTASDGTSADTVAGTAAVLAAAGVRLDVATVTGGSIESQLAPLAAGTGGRVYSISDPTFYTGGFGVATPSPGVPTADLEIKSADYEKGEFSILFNNPPPPSVKSMTAQKAGLQLYQSWVYQGFQSTEGIDAAEKDLALAKEVIEVEAARFGSGSSILTLRDTFLQETAGISTEGAEKLTCADLDEEGANILMLQTRLSLSVTSLSIAREGADSVLKLF